MSGLFITFEGGEGSGKSTQVLRLGERVRSLGKTVTTTREPGGTAGAEAIRALLVNGATDRWDALTELHLINAARRDHVQKRIRPALAEGHVVICDRFIDSTRVYQGVVKGLDDALICRHHKETTDDLWPDLTLLIDLDPDIGLARALSRHEANAETRFENENTEFHRKIFHGFQRFCQHDTQRIVCINGNQSADTVADSVWDVVDARLNTHV